MCTLKDILDEDILDNIKHIKILDRQNMYWYLSSIGKDALISYKNAADIFNFNYGNINNIVGAGMGGSGMAPNVISSLFKDELDVPFIISQNYNIPQFVNSDTLLIAISDSGETEEIISQYYQAKERNAKIIVIGQGSKLLDIAKKDNIPYFKYLTSVPARASFAFMFGACLACLENIGLLRKDKKEGLIESIEVIDKLNNEIGIDVQTKNNIAKKTAIKLKKNVPILYIEPPFESLGHRFTKMFNENARMFAFYNTFPEARHNEIMGWSSDYNLDFIPILLRDDRDNSKMEIELDEVKKFLNANTVEFRAIGKSKISRFFYLLHLVDMISYYEAILVNKDPSETIELKKIKNILRNKKE